MVHLFNMRCKYPWKISQGPERVHGCKCEGDPRRERICVQMIERKAERKTERREEVRENKMEGEKGRGGE